MNPELLSPEEQRTRFLEHLGKVFKVAEETRVINCRGLCVHELPLSPRTYFDPEDSEVFEVDVGWPVTDITETFWRDTDLVQIEAELTEELDPLLFPKGTILTAGLVKGRVIDPSLRLVAPITREFSGCILYWKRPGEQAYREACVSSPDTATNLYHMLQADSPQEWLSLACQRVIHELKEED